jgi:hypothetical protein
MRSIWVGIFLIMMGCRYKAHEKKFTGDTADDRIQKITIGDITATMKWMTTNYSRSTSPYTDNNSDYDYFDLRFDKTGEEKLSKEKIMYLDFDIQKDILLTNGKDSTLPAICQRIQNGYSKSYEYVIAFEKLQKNNDDFLVAYKDKVFGIGAIAFVYKKDDPKRNSTLVVK